MAGGEWNGRAGGEAETRPALLILGPTPPPAHGNSVYTEMLLGSPLLRARYRVLHLDTSDRRSLENLGRFDVRNVVLAVRHLVGLLRVVRRERPALVYVPVSQNGWGYARDGLFILLAKGAGCRVVTHLHGGYFGEFYRRANPLVRWLVRASCRRVDGAVVLGEGLRGVYAGLVAPERVHVVPNGVREPWACEGGGGSRGSRVLPGDGVEGEGEGGGGAQGVGVGGTARAGARSAIAAVRAAGEAGATGVTLGYLGALCAARGLEDLCDALARLGDVRPLPRLVLAGSWLERGWERVLRRRVAELGLGERVEVVGAVAGAAKAAFWRRVDIFVFPSRQVEGQPLAILEAMAAGVPVVATGQGAVADAVRDGETGVLVPPGRADALADGIRRLAVDREARERMGRAGRLRYLECFTPERNVERLAAVLDALLAQGG